MKPKFILSAGIGWCGTTSLYYTLKNIKYVHTGRHKEIHALHRYFDDPTNNNINLDNYDWFLSNLKPYISDENNDDHQIIKKITETDVNYILGPSKSLDNYIKYYLNLYQYLEGNYQAVGDFSNSTNKLTEKSLIEVRNKLSEYFDIKCIFSFRDPIRRAWSQAGAFSNLDETRCFYFLKSLNSFHHPLSDNIFDSFETFCYKDYVSKIKSYYNVFGKENVCYLIMEDLYNPNDQKEKQKLEKFLDIKIDQMYPCCFVPDKGINAPKTNPLLMDQWDSDHHILTPEIYNKYREREDLKIAYSEFEEFHGSLPADWGSPIDYGY